MKIMKLPQALEMKLIKEKKINILIKIQKIFLFFLLLFTSYSCKNTSSKNPIIGTWEIEKIIDNNDSTSFVPEEQKYEMQLLKNGSELIFKVDAISGNWILDDSMLVFENIPESKTYVDSIFVINDSYGNSSIVMQNGNQKIATITENGIEPEKVTSVMNLVYLDDKQLHLTLNGDVYIYNKIEF